MTRGPKCASYGLASLSALRKCGCAFVDKTRFIPALEQSVLRPFITRPRRFGKSLFADMLAAYYDKAEKDNFKKNFAGTWIGEHPTPFASQYLVLRFDFSGIEPGPGMVDGFVTSVKTGLISFQARYLGDDPRAEAVVNAAYDSPALLLADFLNLVLGKFGREEKIYLIVDEYDSLFAQSVLSQAPAGARRVPGNDRFLRAFYGVINRFSSILIERIFVTGVTSVSRDSLLSGMDVETETTSPAFSAMLGFTEAELRGLIPQLVDVERYGHSVDEIVDRMKALYEGYRFSPHSDATVFNPSMCLYYLDEIAETNHEPEVLLDPSFSIGLSKIATILSLGCNSFVEGIVTDVLFDRPVIPLGESPAIRLNADSGLSNCDLLTALVCMGFLTLSSENPARLVCPNRVVKALFFRYWFERIHSFQEIAFPVAGRKKASAALCGGDVRPLLELVAEALRKAAEDPAAAHINETAIGLAVAMVMNTDAVYRVTAEEEVSGAGFTGLILRPGKGHPGAAGWVIEFKYLKKSETTKNVLEAKLSEATEQLERYSKAENIAAIPNLRRAAAVFSGAELKALKVF